VDGNADVDAEMEGFFNLMAQDPESTLLTP
jgi:hypothetical protein